MPASSDTPPGNTALACEAAQVKHMMENEKRSDAERMQLPDGTLVDEKYKVISLLRYATDGFFYRAENLVTGDTVRMKELFPGRLVKRHGAKTVLCREADAALFELYMARFLKGARTIRDFGEMPGVVRIRDSFAWGGTAYWISDFEEGAVLSEIRGPQLYPEVSLREKALFHGMIPVLEALAALHAAGLVHREISPETICMKTPEKESRGGRKRAGKLPGGEWPSFLICDPGSPKDISARRREENRGEGETGTPTESPDGDGIKTAAPEDGATEAPDGAADTAIKTHTPDVRDASGYMAPERFSAEMPEGSWTDLYSFTAVLYYFLTGSAPESSFIRLLGEDLKLPSERGIPVRPALEKILKKGLALQPEKRYQSAEEMLGDIRAAFPEEAPLEEQKIRRRKRRFSVLGALGTAAFAAAVYLGFHPEVIRFHGQETETILFLDTDAEQDIETAISSAAETDRLADSGLSVNRISPGLETGASEDAGFSAAESESSGDSAFPAAKDGSSADDLSDLDIMKERICAFAGDGNFVWKKHGTYAEAILPEALFDTPGTKSALENYLTGSWQYDITLYDIDRQVLDVPLEVMSADVREGVMPGFLSYLEYADAHERSIYTSDPGRRTDLDVVSGQSEHAYVRCRVSGTVRRALEQTMETATSRMLAVYSGSAELADNLRNAKVLEISTLNGPAYGSLADTENKYFAGSSSGSIYVHLEDDPSYVDIAVTAQDPAVLRLVAWNLMHREAESSAVPEFEQKAVWEVPEESLVAGEHQVRENEVRDAVYLTYFTYSSGTEDGMADWYAHITRLKEKLDILAVPYAIGVSEEIEREIIVKIVKKDIPAFYAEGLDRDNYLSLACNASKNLLNAEDAGIRAGKGQQGLCLTLSGSRKEEAEEELTAAAKNGDGKILLLWDDAILASGNVPARTDDKEIRFDQIRADDTGRKKLVSICKNTSSLDSNTGNYDLLKVQSVDVSGIPEAVQDGLPTGNTRHFKESVSDALRKMAGKGGIRVSENGSALYLSLLEDGTYTDIPKYMKNFENILELVVRNLNQDTGFLSDVVIHYNMAEHYSVQIKFRKADNGYISTDDAVNRARRASFGKLTADVSFYDSTASGEDGASWSDEIPLAEAADASDPDTAAGLLYAYLKDSSFFQEYGGEDSWTWQGYVK